MESDLENNAVLAVLVRHAEAWFERKNLLEEITSKNQRVTELEKRLADCEASFRVFGYDVTNTEVWNALTNEYKAQLAPYLMAIAGIKQSSTSVEQVMPPPEQPPIHDLVLKRLSELGDVGSKAAPIRGYVEGILRREIHEKTVGMTLYRLLRKGLVRREGHRWFYVPQDAETQNPGADTPGQKSIFD